MGDTLICRVYKHLGNQRFNVNYRYRIISTILPAVTGNEVRLQGKAVTLDNVKSKGKFTTDIHTLDKHFRYDYCTTCHSAQGASIDGQTIIHEWEKKHLVTREWILCALTRSTNFNKVRFFKSVASQNELNEETLTKYISTSPSFHHDRQSLKQPTSGGRSSTACRSIWPGFLSVLSRSL